MATESSDAEKKNSQKIKFTLEVSSSLYKGKVDKIDFKMNLNPKEKLIAIDQHLSGYKELLAIFEEIGKVLGEINDKTNAYNTAIDTKPEVYKRLQFNAGYEENFKPSFGKIDKIHYQHESPGVSNVSYTRTYNGDMEPPR